MKRSVLSFVLVMLCALVAFSFVSCNPEKIEQGPYGSLAVSVDQSVSRTIQPADGDITVVKYKLFGQLTPEVTYESPDFFTTASTSVDRLIVGSWSFYVVGYNADGLAVARSASKTVQIRVSQTASASFALEYLGDGEGTLNLTFKVPETNNIADKIIISLTNVDPAKASPEDITIAKPATATDGFFVFTSTSDVATGNYRMVAKAYNGETELNTISIQSVFIFKDIDSDFIMTVKENGKTESPVFVPVDSLVTASTDITLSCATPGSYIYYTTDSSKDPIKDGTLYTGPIHVDRNTTIYAVAGSVNKYMSEKVSKDYHVKATSPVASVTPGTFDNAQTVLLSTTTAGSDIRYTTDGTAPNAESTLYTAAGITVDRNTVVKAITVNAEYDNSDVSTFEYRIKTQTPTSNVPEDFYGKRQNVVLSAAAGASIYYTLDGTEPTNESTLFNGSIEIAETATIKAIAYCEGYEPSYVFTETISIVHLSAPVFSLGTGTYETDQTLTITQAENADIYYTTDGSTPTTESTRYTAAIAIDRTMTVKAIASKATFDDTTAVSAKYTMKVADITVTGEGGEFTTRQSLELNTTTPNAVIYYTTDGTVPTASNGIAYTSAISISESKTIKAIAVREGWTSTSVVSVGYTITSGAGFLVSNPQALKTLTITIPDEWEGAESVVPGVAAVLTASLSGASNAEYTWYVDGELVSTGSNLYLGTYEPGNTYLYAGQHLIECESSSEGRRYSSEMLLSVDPNSTTGDSGDMIEVGMRGPAGGYIFYDKGDYSDGWRYLEASPEDISVGSTTGFVFGYYRTSDSGSNLYVNGMKNYNKADCTGTAIGTGKSNTEKLVAAMGETAYSSSSGSSKTSNYAAKLCADYSLNGYDDWFLPSKDELNEMYKALKCEGGNRHGSYCSDKTHAATSTAETRGSFDNYYVCWSSSESSSDTNGAWDQYFGSGSQSSSDRSSNYRVRAVRAF